MVQHQAQWFAQAGRGDGTPPEALWNAVWAEDWPTVRSEWDKWVQPALRKLHDTGEQWRVTAAVMADAAVRAVGEPFTADRHDPIAVRREWGGWIREQATAARDEVRTAEWAEFSEALPAKLRGMATDHPSRQAERAATAFEIEALQRHLDADEGS